MDFHGIGFRRVFKSVFGEPTRQVRPTGWLRSEIRNQVCNQRLEMYIVISKPRRMSIAAGVSHVIRLLLQGHSRKLRLTHWQNIRQHNH
jgi:hypothetical protein